MARSRNIKPGFFKNYELADMGPLAQILFAGLWCLADRQGRLEDKPRLIKAEIFPYYDCDVNGELTKLQRLKLVDRYVVDGVAVISVVNFKKHQTPHNTEKQSTLPAMPDGYGNTSIESTPCTDNGGFTVDSRNSNDGKPPDSLNTDSLIPDSLSSPAEKSAEPEKPDTELQAACKETWKSYSSAYFARYGTEPVRNATVNSQVKSFVKRLSYDESPQVAAWFLDHTASFYVSGGHGFNLLLKDAEKLRTEWATGRRMNGTKARQVERAGSMVDAVNEILSERAGT